MYHIDYDVLNLKGEDLNSLELRFDHIYKHDVTDIQYIPHENQELDEYGVRIKEVRIRATFKGEDTYDVESVITIKVPENCIEILSGKLYYHREN